MEALKQAVAAAFDNVVASGAIEQAIEKQISETITKVVEEQFRSYSDFGKSIKDLVGRAVNLNLDEIDMPTYGDLVLKIIRRQLDVQMHGEFAKRLEADMAVLLAPGPTEISLEQIVESFVNSYKEEYGTDRSGQEFTLLYENDSTFTYLYLDKDEDVGKWQCDYRIGIHKGEVFSLSLGGNDVKDKLFIGGLRDFEKMIFQMHTRKTKVTISDDFSASDYNHFPYRD